MARKRKAPTIHAFTEREWRAETKALLERVPAPHGYSVVFRRSKSLGSRGLCDFDGKRKAFTIRVATDMSHGELVETLIHEMAHVLAWGFAGAAYFNNDHSPYWGVAYAFTYSEYMQAK